MTHTIKGNYFDGKYHQPSTTGLNAVERYIERTCPGNTEHTLWTLPVDYDHCDGIIDSALSGYKFWRNKSFEERAQFLKRYQEQVLARKMEIATAIALETGKPLWEATGEVASVIGKVNVTLEESLPRIKNQTFPDIAPNNDGEVFFKPLGICLIIGPFNFPCHLANTQILSSLIAGNSIIFKPSEKTAYSAQLLIDCFHDAGFPKGVINMIQGDGETARRLSKRKEVKGIFFTGSKEVGLKVLENTKLDMQKLVALELGGKNPAIIHKDAHIDNALEEIMRGSYLTSGQRCTSTSIVAIHESHVQSFIEKFHTIAKRIIVDHPTEHDIEPFMGPLIDQKAVDVYLNYIGMAKREGIEEIMRGKQITKKYPGHYVTPSIHLAEKFDTNSHFMSDEIFGPNCTFIPYKEIEEAIEIANSTEYGLASSIFTQDDSIFKKCVWDIEAGLVNLNRATCGASAKLPFGGVKNSGNYRPMAVASIDSCAYPLASLKLKEVKLEGFENMRGIEKV